MTDPEITSKEVRSPLRYGEDFLGYGWLSLEVTLGLVALAVWALFRVVGMQTSLAGTFIFTYCIGNWSSVLLNLAQPLFVPRKAPWNWIIYLLLILLVGVSGSIVATTITLLVFVGPKADFTRSLANQAPIGTLVTLIFSIVNYIFRNEKAKHLAESVQLQGQVQLGRIKEQSHEAELAQAHEIQRHLLPRETPQIAGFQIACAWQPAKAVSGDYFDVFPVGEDKLALCLADVSGKGITAALLMANLQASVRAFAQEAASPAALCAKLNSVLCETVAPGKFVTLFYGVVHSLQHRLQYENAGHCLPLLVRADGSVEMPASYSGVLGLFSHWTYQDSELELSKGDCLVLVTDGVLEAANRNEEEFGYHRLIDTVLRSRAAGVDAVRKAILEEVTAFCGAVFSDDASLIVVMAG